MTPKAAAAQALVDVALALRPRRAQCQLFVATRNVASMHKRCWHALHNFRLEQWLLFSHCPTLWQLRVRILKWLPVRQASVGQQPFVNIAKCTPPLGCLRRRNRAAVLLLAPHRGRRASPAPARAPAVPGCLPCTLAAPTRRRMLALHACCFPLGPITRACCAPECSCRLPLPALHAPRSHPPGKCSSAQKHARAGWGALGCIVWVLSREARQALAALLQTTKPKRKDAYIHINITAANDLTPPC